MFCSTVRIYQRGICRRAGPARTARPDSYQDVALTALDNTNYFFSSLLKPAMSFVPVNNWKQFTEFDVVLSEKELAFVS